MLSVLRVHLPSEIPVVGCEIMPNVLLRRPDNSISNDDVPESAPLVGYYMRYRICEELFIGIPHRAWWVGIAALLCLLVAAAIPYFLPLHLLSRTQDMQLGNISTMKDS